MASQSSIRIIGGKWRSRKISFESKDTLRPTPDRVRETLFNWLAPYIVGTVCLDLYAGSGVLGFEALSRGASKVLAVDNDRANIVNIDKNRLILQATDLMAINKNVVDWLQGRPIVADIVFVDPPYSLRLLPETLTLLETNAWVHPDSLIYFEQSEPLDPNMLPAGWVLWRHSKAGMVYYYLARKEC